MTDTVKTFSQLRGEDAALREVRRLSSYFCNEDTPGEEQAAEALSAGLPAYWSTTVSSNVLSMWRDYINAAGSVVAGLAAYRAEGGRGEADKRLLERFLGRLIPLNAAAVSDLASAYVSILGTWREEGELTRRNHNFADTSSPVPAPSALFTDTANSRALEKLNG